MPNEQGYLRLSKAGTTAKLEGETMSNKKWIFLAAFVFAAGPALAQSLQSLPPIVRKALKEAHASSCKDAKGVTTGDTIIKWGFIAQRDINGDGIDDYVLDYGQVQCGNRQGYCGSSGCHTEVFASQDDGTFTKVLDENVLSLHFQYVNGRPAMIIGKHGSVCNRPGYQPCSTTLFWNGASFHSAN
jgi:hypothetical protein